MYDRRVSAAPPDDQFAAAVERAVLRQLEADELELPSLPLAAVRTFALLADPDYQAADVARLIESDPLLAARLLRLVNSAAFAGRQPTTGIRDCVTRLGALQLRRFLVEMSAQQVIESRDPRIAEFCRGLWQHSLGVALMAREIARGAAPAQAETAYLAGLLHDVGKPLLAALLVSAERRLLGSRTAIWIPAPQWLRFVVEKHRPVGLALVGKWGLPETVRRSIADSVEYDVQDPRSMSNAVRLANALAKLNGLYVGETDPEEAQSQRFVGQQLFGLDEAATDHLASEARAEIERRA